MIADRSGHAPLLEYVKKGPPTSLEGPSVTASVLLPERLKFPVMARTLEEGRRIHLSFAASSVLMKVSYTSFEDALDGGKQRGHEFAFRTHTESLLQGLGSDRRERALHRK
jgi:hypothetical protein